MHAYFSIDYSSVHADLIYNVACKHEIVILKGIFFRGGYMQLKTLLTLPLSQMLLILVCTSNSNQTLHVFHISILCRHRSSRLANSSHRSCRSNHYRDPFCNCLCHRCDHLQIRYIFFEVIINSLIILCNVDICNFEF